jgi:ribulose-5-phosphate 4-epimerase/fuculose-1-phosphate aldolase
MTRTRIAGFALALWAVMAGAAFAATAPSPVADTDEQRIADLVVANHILAAQGVLDGFGHISVRSAANPEHFFLARSVAPALVTRADILEFDKDSQPVVPGGPAPYSERFIHGEIFRARPDVQSVVHGHTPSVLPFTVTHAPLKALIHVASFLGTEAAPVFDIRDAEGEDNLMLVTSGKTAAVLAKALGKRSVVLMRGHGMAVAGASIRQAVFFSVYTQANAQVETEALKLGPPVFMNRFEVQRTETIGRTRQWELWATSAAH